jgi:hypothetical protein
VSILSSIRVPKSFDFMQRSEEHESALISTNQTPDVIERWKIRTTANTQPELLSTLIAGQCGKKHLR